MWANMTFAIMLWAFHNDQVWRTWREARLVAEEGGLLVCHRVDVRVEALVADKWGQH